MKEGRKRVKRDGTLNTPTPSHYSNITTRLAICPLKIEENYRKMEVIDSEGDRKAKGLPRLDGEGPVRQGVCRRLEDDLGHGQVNQGRFDEGNVKT